MKNLRTFKLSGLIILLTAAVLILSNGCSIEKPEAPTWDAKLSVPLISHHYEMLELVDRMAEDAISYDSAGNITLSFSQTIDTVIINAGLTANDITEEFNHQLGVIELESPPAIEVELNLTDYLAISAGDIPESGFSAAKEFDDITEFESATFDNGKLILTISNYFDLQIDSLTIWIVDDLSADTLAEYFFDGGLAIGQSKVDTVDLQGKTASNQLSMSSRIHTPGGTLLTVSDKYLSVILGFANGITVSSALAKIPEQQKSYSSSISFNEDHRLTSASLSSGQLDIQLENNSALSAELNIQFDELTSSGTPLTVTVIVPAGGTYNINQNLDGYVLEPDLQGLDMTVGIDLEIEIPGSGNDVVEITSLDNFNVSAELSSLSFSEVSGVIAPTMIEMPTLTTELDLPRGLEEIRLTDAVAHVTIYSEVDIPTEVEIFMEGDAGQYMSINSDLNGGSPQNPGVTEIVISDLTALTDPLPSEIVVSGVAQAGDGVSSGTIYSDSKVWGEVEISSPLKFAIGETEIDGDVNSTEIEQEDIDEVSDRLNEGTIYATVTNHLPFGCEVELFFAGDSATLYTNPQLTIGPIIITGGTVDALGFVTEATISDITINMSESDLDIIENPILYVGERITLPGTNGQVVTIINTDYLNIEAIIELDARMGGDWD
jgi:hypothetical protein